MNTRRFHFKPIMELQVRDVVDLHYWGKYWGQPTHGIILAPPSLSTGHNGARIYKSVMMQPMQLLPNGEVLLDRDARGIAVYEDEARVSVKTYEEWRPKIAAAFGEDHMPFLDLAGDENHRH
jgi:hypothetical protein